MLQYYEIGEEVRVDWDKGVPCHILAIDEGQYLKGEVYYTILKDGHTFHGIHQDLLTKVYEPSKVSFQELLKL
jgi:hypothetical protein